METFIEGFDLEHLKSCRLRVLHARRMEILQRLRVLTRKWSKPVYAWALSEALATSVRFEPLAERVQSCSCTQNGNAPLLTKQEYHRRRASQQTLWSPFTLDEMKTLRCTAINIFLPASQLPVV